MSKYRKMATKFTSRVFLRAALKAAGVPFEETLPGKAEKHLYGYQDKQRSETATFIVRREHLTVGSNDLGFHWDPDSRCFTEIVSNYDSNVREVTRLRQTVKREYAVSTATSAAKAKGYNVVRVNGANGTVQLKVTGRI